MSISFFLMVGFLLAVMVSFSFFFFSRCIVVLKCMPGAFGVGLYPLYYFSFYLVCNFFSFTIVYGYGDRMAICFISFSAFIWSCFLLFLFQYCRPCNVLFYAPF